MMVPSILVISADREFIRHIRCCTADGGWRVAEAASPDRASLALLNDFFDAVVLDGDSFRMGVASWRDGANLRKWFPPVVVVSRNGTISDAVAALRAGAADYLSPIPEPEELLTALEQALRRAGGDGAGDEEEGETLPGLVAAAPESLSLSRRLARVAGTDVPVALLGEEGTGRKHAARKMHEVSLRRFGVLLCVDARALRAARGRVAAPRGAACGGGTLIIEGVDEASWPRVSGLIGPMGHGPGFVRVVFVGAPSLARLIRNSQGRGRHMAVFTLPPLRERLADIPLLARHFLRTLTTHDGRPARVLSSEAQDALLRYAWPGNVSELREVLECSAAASKGAVLGLDALPDRVKACCAPAGRSGSVPLRTVLHARERRYILHALQSLGGDKELAARSLLISRSTLYKKLSAPGPERP